MPFFSAGFTIIELLVVLAIIALMASLAIVFFSPTAAKSRDARREEDIKSMQGALNLYINQNSLYPICPSEAVIDGNSDCLSSALLGAEAIKSMPVGPKFTGAGTCGGENSFVYCYQSSNGISYSLRYYLETDTVSGKIKGWQSVNP